MVYQIRELFKRTNKKTEKPTICVKLHLKILMKEKKKRNKMKSKFYSPIYKSTKVERDWVSVWEFLACLRDISLLAS